jgi:hypothetical protein
MFDILLRLFRSNRPSTKTNRRDKRIRLSLQGLEDRVVPAAIWTVNALGDTGEDSKTRPAGELEACVSA